MTPIAFTAWMARFTDAEYSLLRHRMRGIQFIGPNIQRRWDLATAVNMIDLDDPIMPQFKDALVSQNVISSARADVIFAPPGPDELPPSGSGDGTQGPAGPQGPPGPAGATGPQGLQGDLGPQGTQGPQGPAGQDGAQGPAGPAGPAGPQGDPGAQGAAGADGAAGIPGVPGPAGPAGPQGDVGPAGTDGPAGPQGLQGPQGDLGAAGAAGPAGPQGDQGPPGTTATIIGSFSTKTIADLPPSGYIQADWDSPGNPPAGNQMANGQGLLYAPTQEVCLWVGPTLTPAGWVVLGDVQGPAGPVGPQGPAGIAGPQGAEGAQGPVGPQGPKGDVGAAGPQGPAGAQGTQGLPGAQGPQGLQGAAGATGAQGAPGAQGQQGIQGVQGIPGPTAVSADASNTATLGSDGKIFVPVFPAGSNATPLVNGTAAPGTAITWSRNDHVHPTDTSRMPIKGTVAADQAAAGNVGEQLAVSQTTAVSLTTAVTANIATLALTPGDWSVSGVVIFAEATNTIPTMLAAAVATVSGTLPTAAQVAAGTGNMTQYALAFTKGVNQTMQAGVCRINVSANTNIFLVAQSTFSGGTLTATGYISARRVR
jgi:hypothetical protein